MSGKKFRSTADVQRRSADVLGALNLLKTCKVKGCTRNSRHERIENGYCMHHRAAGLQEEQERLKAAQLQAKIEAERKALLDQMGDFS